MEWSSEEVEYLKKHQEFMTFREIGEVLGRSRCSVKKKWGRMNAEIERNKPIIVGKVSSEEKSFLQKLRKWLR